MKQAKTVTRWFIGAFLLLAFAACASNPTSRSTGTYMDDKVISTKVESALIADETTKALQIDVETYNGVVQLSGFVDDENAKQQAEKIAKDVKGVVDVKNDLIIRK